MQKGNKEEVWRKKIKRPPYKVQKILKTAQKVHSFAAFEFMLQLIFHGLSESIKSMEFNPV